MATLLIRLVFVFSLLHGFGSRCVEGAATRHDAFDKVFRAFPDRLTPGVDGYIAVQDCADLGRYYWLTTPAGEGGSWFFLVRAADCLNEAHRPAFEEKWKGGWVADVSLQLWRQAELPARPVSVILCHMEQK